MLRFQTAGGGGESFPLRSFSQKKPKQNAQNKNSGWDKMADIYNPEDQEIIRHLFYLLHLNLYCYTNSTSSCAASGGTSWYEVILKR